MKSKFEEWFQQQSFYLNLRFIHGDRLFASENGVYRILAVQIAWVSWMDHQKQVDILTDWLKEADASQEKMQSIVDEQQKRIGACENLLAKWRSKGLVGSSDYARGGLHSRQDCEDELEQALKGDMNE